MLWRALDALLLVTIVAGPWVLLAYALSRFRDLLRRDRWVLLLLGAGLWLFLAAMLSPLTETPVQAILHSTTKPWFSAYRESILVERQAPLWMPQLGTGLPALASPYVGYMTPFTSLLLLFDDLDQGVNVLVVAHLVFAGLSAYLLSRSLGLGRGVSLLVVVPAIWNPWVFRRLGTEVHALYLFGFAWLPLAWALVLAFVRTRALGDAVAAGIPLAFMAVSMPTVLAHAVFMVEFFLAAAAVAEIVRRRWSALLRLAAGGGLLFLASFLAAAPEHLAARELFSVTAGTRFERSWITGGWRERDFSPREFVRLLLPNQLGARLVPLNHRVDAFGVPFSPGDAIVVIAALGAATVFIPRFRRSRSILVPHLALFLALASIATRGIAYRPVRWVDPLWGYAGNFPVLGALVLMIILVCFGVGLDALARAVRAGARVARDALARGGSAVARRLRSASLWSAGVRVVLFAGAALLVVESLWGVRNFIATAPTDPDGRPDLRFTVSIMPLADLQKLPHMTFLASLTKDAEFPTRIYCSGDRPVWPSPCFDYAVSRARTEAVGTGELAWAMPRWQWNIFTELWSASDGTIQPVLERLLQLAGVEYLLHPRDLPYPVVERVKWNPSPGNFELFGRFLGSSTGGGAWKEAWDEDIRVHRFPGFPRVFFAPAAALTGGETESDAVVRELLANPDFTLNNLVLLQTAVGADLSRAATGDAAGIPTVATAAEALALEKPAPRAKLRLQSPRAGAWVVDGHIPKDGALLFSQMYYPGMRASVNGRRVPVFRADLFLTAVPVQRGETQVTLEYAPTGILASGLLTAGFAALLALSAITRPASLVRRLVLRPRERSRRSPL